MKPKYKNGKLNTYCAHLIFCLFYLVQGKAYATLPDHAVETNLDCRVTLLIVSSDGNGKVINQ